MKRFRINYVELKVCVKIKESDSTTQRNSLLTAVGTCLGECVKCGASCCMDAGHPRPHFCYLCM